MMNTDKEIKRIAQEMCPNYCYGTPYYLNTRTDDMRAKKQMPACLHIQSITRHLSTGGHSITETPEHRKARHHRDI